MKRITPTVLTIFGLCHLSNADVASNEQLLASILAKAVEQHRAIGCIHAEANMLSVHPDDHLLLENLPPENKSLFQNYKFDYAGAKWRIDVTAKKSSGEVAYSLVSAFDGERIYSHERGGAMRITTDKEWLNGWLHFSGVLLFPYSFLKSGDEVRNGLPTTLATISTIPPQELLRGVKIEAVERGLQVTFPRENSSDLVIFSAKDHYYPVFFRRSGRDEAGDVEVTFETEELGRLDLGGSASDNILHYPRRGALKLYRNKLLQRTDTIEITSLTTNGCDEETFTLDPSEATHIFDADSNTTIVLPK